MGRYFGLFICVVFFLGISCQQTAPKNILEPVNEKEINRDSLVDVVRSNTALYTTYRNKHQGDSALKFLQKIEQLKKYCSGHDSLAAYYRSAMLKYAFEFDSREQYLQAENILQELLNNPGPWVNKFNQADAAAILGNIYTRYGDYKKALLWLKQAEKEYRRFNDTVYFVKAANNEAIVLRELQLFDSARNLLADAEQWNTPITESKVILYTQSAIAALHLGDRVSGYKYISKAEGQLADFQDEEERSYYQAFIDGIKGDLLFSSKQYRRAVSLLRTSITVNESLDSSFTKSRDCGKLYNLLGRAYAGVTQFDSALYCSNRALYSVTTIDTTNIFSLPVAVELYPENTILESLDAKADALSQLHEQKADLRYLQTAIDCYVLSFEVERKLMQNFSYDESKLLMLADSRKRSQKAIALCYDLYQTTKDNAWAEKAFQFAEKSKAFVLLESVKRNLASNNLLQNDTLYQRAQSLQLQLAYNERSFAESTSDSARRELSKQKTQLENDLLFANTALSRQSNAYKAVMQKEDSISTKMLTSDLLNEETGLIEFFSTDSITYAFVVDKDQPVKFIQYKASLSSQIDSLLNYFKNPTAISNDPMNYQRAAYNLYNELGLSLINKNWKQLIVIPDGKLSFVPFDALITSANFNTNLQQSPWLIQQCNAVYGYSALILLTQKNNNSNDATNISVFAPVFANNENGQKPLLFSQQEAEAVDRNNNNQVFTKKDASLANFRKQFEQPGILHIASHAYADTGTNNNPKIEFIDSSLLLNELYAMHTKASLVVLSACETGIGKVSSSEGPMSLARGFYYAGAKNVITSYWSVDDKSTAALFKDFYKILPGSTSSTALCEAKRSFIKNTSASYASPYYWAGFVHFGMPQEKEGGGYWWWLLAIPAVSLLIYWIKRMMQNKETEFYLKEKTGFEKRLDKK